MLINYLRILRPTQWIKNGVVLAALIFSGEVNKPGSLITALMAVFIFCLLSSAIYLLNDIIDRKKDCLHPLKKERPIAAGQVSVIQASIIAVIFMIVGTGFAYRISAEFCYVAIAFLILNISYSLFLKNLVLIDVMTIAGSFVLRAYAGAVAIDVTASKWMLINTLLLALFLGFGKRRHELVLLDEKANEHRSSLERYSPYLLDQCIGITTASVVVMYMLYSFSSEVSTKLGTENLFLTIPFVVYGVFRYLYLIHKEEKGGSPTRVLLTDKPIMITVILWMATAIIVLYYVK